MEPITRSEIYMAASAGEYDGELPEPVTRQERYWKKIVQRIDAGSSISPESIDAAIADYLNTHDADIVTEAELSEALEDKADSADIPDVSGFIGADVNNLTNYYDKDAVDTALAGKSNAGHAHDDRYYTETEVDTALSGKSDSGHSHVVTDVTGLESALAGKAAASHSHDDRYYTETEIDGKLGEKSNTGHAHDERYYTQTVMNALLEGKADSADVPDVSAFITRLVDDLVNYYTKSETYTKTEIDNMVSAIPKFAIQVVNSLPTQNISPTTVYLLTSQTQENGNLYTEYLYVGNSWELLGSQTVDLSGYYTAAEVDALLNGLSVSGHTHDDRYYTESEIDSKIQTINTAISGKAASDHTHDDRYYTETEIDNKLSEKSNTGHSHVSSDVTGLDSALAGKADATATQTALNAKQDALTAGDNVSIATVNGVLTISATDTDTTYSAGTGLLLSGTTFSNSAPNVKSDWNAATGTDAEILNKPDLSIYAPATIETLADAHMSYNVFTSDGQIYPKTYTLLKNAKNYRFLIIRSLGSTAGGYLGGYLWEFITVPSPTTSTASILLRRVDISGSTLTEYIFGLQFSADGTTITITYGPNNIPAHIAIWGIK